MWYLIKQALIPIAYLFFSAIIAMGVFSIDGCDPIIMIILLLVNLGIYIFVVVTLTNKEGNKGYTVLVSNDKNRERIVETGEDLPLRKAEEYKVWKGFAIGAIICAPLIVLMIIHTILIFAVGPQSADAGAIASFIYSLTYSFSRVFATADVGALDYYWSLTFIPISLLSAGIPYILGAKKAEGQQQMIKEIHKNIHGENS